MDNATSTRVHINANVTVWQNKTLAALLCLQIVSLTIFSRAAVKRVVSNCKIKYDRINYSLSDRRINTRLLDVMLPMIDGKNDTRYNINRSSTLSTVLTDRAVGNTDLFHQRRSQYKANAAGARWAFKTNSSISEAYLGFCKRGVASRDNESIESEMPRVSRKDGLSPPHKEWGLGVPRKFWNFFLKCYILVLFWRILNF